MTRVTIVSAYYNREDHVADSVRSLLDQDHDDLEIIICDDGSTDGTLAALQAISDPRLTIMSQANAGFVTTMNRMIARATGDYIAVHGSGDVSLPTRISKQAALLDGDPRIVLAGCIVEGERGEKRPVGWDRPGPHPLREQMMRDNPFSHGEMMFRKSAFDAVGGYRPIFRFAQDRDLWLRIGRYGGYGVVPELLYRRRNLPGSVSRTPEKVILQKKLAAFAIQCAQSIDAKGRDPVDRHGELALLLARRSKTTGRWLARLGGGYIRRGDVAGGRELMRAAIDEHVGPTTIVAALLARVPEDSGLWRLLRRRR